MKIYDSHIHLGDWNYGHYKTVSPDIHEIDRVLKQSGISGGIILPSDKLDNDDCLRQLKNAELKYWCFAWIDPKIDSMVQWLKDNIHRIDGIKCHAGLNQIKGNISNPLYEPILDIAQEYDLPVLAHAGRWQEMSSYKGILDAAEHYPKVKFICAHLGGDFEGLKLQAPKDIKERNLDNVWFDISATREYWTIKRAADIVGTEKILFASDYPVMHPKMSIESIEVLDFTDDEKENMYCKNLLKIMSTDNE